MRPIFIPIIPLIRIAAGRLIFRRMEARGRPTHDMAEEKAFLVPVFFIDNLRTVRERPREIPRRAVDAAACGGTQPTPSSCACHACCRPELAHSQT